MRPKTKNTSRKRTTRDSSRDEVLSFAPADELGCVLHTALRKCCDSKPSTAAYHLIREMDQGWDLYLKHVRTALLLVKEPEQVPEALRAASKKLAWRDESAALRAVFDMFSAADWCGFASYVLMDEKQAARVDRAVMHVATEENQEMRQLEMRINGMARTLSRIRTKADVASGVDDQAVDPDLLGRAAGAEGAVDLLIARYSGLLSKRTRV